jgi:hypothetical protein
MFDRPGTSRISPATGRRALTTAAICGLATVLASCGSSSQTLDTGGIERAIAASILSQHKLHTTVVCPAHVALEQGHTFTCTARLQAGTYPVTVSETDAHGHVRYENSAPLVVLDSAKVRAAIAASILRQRNLHANVTCPKVILQRQGVRFVCTATEHGRSTPFDVVETDEHGHVRYVGR